MRIPNKTHAKKKASGMKIHPLFRAAFIDGANYFRKLMIDINKKEQKEIKCSGRISDVQVHKLLENPDMSKRWMVYPERFRPIAGSCPSGMCDGTLKHCNCKKVDLYDTGEFHESLDVFRLHIGKNRGGGSVVTGLSDK